MADSPMDAKSVAATLRELSAVMHGAEDLGMALRHLADLAAAMPGRPMAGVTLRQDGRVQTVASSAAHVRVFDEIQYRGGQGPCLDAMATGEPVLATDLATETRWSDYPPRMLAHGVRSVHSEPLRVEGVWLGALNLYSRRPGALVHEARRAARLTAEHIGLLLDAALRSARQIELATQLREALGTRAIIDQALGILMGEHHWTAHDAFDLLRQISQQQNRKVREVSSDLIQSVSGHPPESLHFDDPPY
ncbi:GAF and ANTAR domain-containing protein [Nonomuraea sp. NPDC026600]|uniref:GAF and ANTAR domain-containing protein n=1 Tax=Nonomuraea sp. NPDC026600 TaxID=3155363 RepID=UPI0033D2C077